MTPEAQRIAIAEACGYIVFDTKSDGGEPHGFPPKDVRPDTRATWYDGHSKLAYVLPDYLSDLNAMHEAEEVLRGMQCEDYYDALMAMTPHTQGMFVIVHATAAQRAEAFLRTLNLWTDK